MRKLLLLLSFLGFCLASSAQADRSNGDYNSSTGNNDGVYTFCVVIGVVVSIIMVVKFFQLASNIELIAKYVSGKKTFNQCINAAELEIVKGNKDKALELLNVAKYLNTNTRFAEEKVTLEKFENIIEQANKL